MKKAFCCFSALLFLCVSPLYAWNAEGHRVVAQIALDYMTPRAKACFQVAHPRLDNSNFTEAAVWFDTLRDLRIPGLNSMHYVDIPIGFTPFTQLTPKPVHGLMAYTGARRKLLLGEGSALEQVIALRILLHVTADLHQPLHAATKDDAGGNKTRLPRNKTSRNLHTYWDRAGGFLSNRMPLLLRAHVLEKRWPCDLEAVNTDPMYWLAESHVIAQEKAYAFKHQRHLDESYQHDVYEISYQRLAEAGCRLAAVLNEIDAYGVPVVG